MQAGWEKRTYEECLAKGRAPETLATDVLWVDRISEIANDGNGGGEVVW